MLQSPIISDKCFVISPRYLSLRVVEECRYISKAFYSDINDNFAPSLNCEIKEPEVNEVFVLFKSFQDAFAPRYAEGNIGSNEA